MSDTANRPAWGRSSRCVGDEHCVEVAVHGQAVLLRNSTKPDAVLALSRHQWRDLIAWLRSRGGGA